MYANSGGKAPFGALIERYRSGNEQAARIIINDRRHGPESLMHRWAMLVLSRVRQSLECAA